MGGKGEWIKGSQVENFQPLCLSGNGKPCDCRLRPLISKLVVENSEIGENIRSNQEKMFRFAPQNCPKVKTAEIKRLIEEVKKLYHADEDL